MQVIQLVLLSTAPASVALHPTEYQLQKIHGSAGENPEEDNKNNQQATKCPIGKVWMNCSYLVWREES